MGDIAGGSRFVAGCARCLRTALAGIRTTDDEDGMAETRRTRRARPGRSSSFSLAGLRLASSVAVASGSQRVRAALASIPIVDEDELEGAGQAGLRRRMALASPAVAAGLLAGAVTTAPAGAQEAPASTAPASGQKIQPQQQQQPQPPAPAPPPAQPPMMIELTGGAGVPTPIGPWGGELGILVNPEDGSFQFTGLGGLYAGGKFSGEYRQARAPGVVGEAKLQGGLGPYSFDLVGQTDLQRVGGSWKAQGGPLVVGQSYEVMPNPSVQERAGAQARIPGPAPVAGLVGAAGVRATSPVIPIDLLATVDEWRNSQPIDPARFEGVPTPEDPWVTLLNWVNDQFGSQGSPQAPASPPADWSEAGELGGAYGQQIGVPGASSGSGGLLGAYADQIGAQGGQGAQGGTLRPVDLTQLQEQFAEAWNELAEADPSGGMAATTPSADDLAVLGEALNQLWGQITGTAGTAAPGPLPVLPPAFDQLIAQDPALAQLLAQLGAQDPALAQLIVQDPALAQLLAQNPGLAQALAQDPTLAPALSQALAPVPTGEAGAPPAIDWGQVLQDMNGPVLVDPEAFQDQPASDMDELDTEDADTDEADTDGVDEPAFDMDDVDDMDDAESESDGEGEDDSESLEPESEDDSESDDGDDEEPSDDWAEEDESEPESEDDSESETDTDDGESEEESESDDDGGEEESEPESDDDGGEEESEPESDDDGGDESESDDDGGEEESEPESESDDGGGGDESDGGGGEEGDGGGEAEPAPDDSGGGGEADDGGGGETDAPAPASPEPEPAPEESAEIGPEYYADSSWTGMVEDSGTCDVC